MIKGAAGVSVTINNQLKDSGRLINSQEVGKEPPHTWPQCDRSNTIKMRSTRPSEVIKIYLVRKIRNLGHKFNTLEMSKAPAMIKQ